jgi:hypothetical protein
MLGSSASTTRPIDSSAQDGLRPPNFIACSSSSMAAKPRRTLSPARRYTGDTSCPTRTDLPRSDPYASAAQRLAALRAGLVAAHWGRLDDQTVQASATTSRTRWRFAPSIGGAAVAVAILADTFIVAYLLREVTHRTCEPNDPDGFTRSCSPVTHPYTATAAAVLVLGVLLAAALGLGISRTKIVGTRPSQ